MAFGFSDSKPPRRPSGGSPYSHQGGSGSPYSGRGGTSSPYSDGGGLESPLSGGTGSQSPLTPSQPGGGFLDRPDSRAAGSDTRVGSGRGPKPLSNPGGNPRGQKKPRPRRGAPDFSSFNIPWRLIIYGVLIAFAVVMIVIFREEIRAFLSEVLSWLIIIGVIILALRLFVFRRRR